MLLGRSGTTTACYCARPSDNGGEPVVAAEVTRTMSSAEGMEALGAALWEAGVGPGHAILLYGCVRRESCPPRIQGSGARD